MDTVSGIDSLGEPVEVPESSPKDLMHIRLDRAERLPDLPGNAPVLELEERLDPVMQASKTDLSTRAPFDQAVNLEDALHVAGTGLRSRVLSTDGEELVD